MKEHWNDTDDEIIKQNAVLLRRNSVQRVFTGYNYDSPNALATVPISKLENSVHSHYASNVSSTNQSNEMYQSIEKY